jgi:hypothetical protein
MVATIARAQLELDAAVAAAAPLLLPSRLLREHCDMGRRTRHRSADTATDRRQTTEASFVAAARDACARFWRGLAGLEEDLGELPFRLDPFAFEIEASKRLRHDRERTPVFAIRPVR